MKEPLIRQVLGLVQHDIRTGCWWWLGQRHLGYGRISVGGRSRMAHRVTYELFREPIPAGLTLDHLCRHTSCVNPAHLEPVTLTENILRGYGPPANNRRKERCSCGSEYDRSKRGDRVCRRCISEYNRAYKLKKKRERKGVAA